MPLVEPDPEPEPEEVEAPPELDAPAPELLPSLPRPVDSPSVPVLSMPLDPVLPVSVEPTPLVPVELTSPVEPIALVLEPIGPEYGWAQIPSTSTQEVPAGQACPPAQSSTHTPTPSITASLQRAGAVVVAAQQSQSPKQPRVQTPKLSPSLRHCPLGPQSPGHGS